MVVFARHNVISDAPFTRLDLVTCRNLLIYFQPPAQKKALSLFHFGLKTGGHLFLGPSETPGELSDEFEPLDGRWKIYRKRRDIRLPADMRLPVAAPAGAIVDGARRAPPGRRDAAGRLRPADGAPHAAVLPGRRTLRAPALVRRRRVAAGDARRADLHQPARAGAGGAARPDGRRAAAGRQAGQVGALYRHRGRYQPGAGALPAHRGAAAGREARHGQLHHPGGGGDRAQPGRGCRRGRRRAGIARLRHLAGGRAPLHARESTGHHRGAGDLQRGAAGHQRGAGRGQRGAAEHQRGAALGQRGAPHGQRRAPAQDRSADRADRRHGQPAPQHRHRRAVPRSGAERPQVHAPGGGALQPPAPGRRAQVRPLRAQHRLSASSVRDPHGDGQAHADRGRGADRAGRAALRPRSAVPIEGRRARGRAHHRGHQLAAPGRGRGAPPVRHRAVGARRHRRAGRAGAHRGLEPRRRGAVRLPGGGRDRGRHPPAHAGGPPPGGDRDPGPAGARRGRGRPRDPAGHARRAPHRHRAQRLPDAGRGRKAGRHGDHRPRHHGAQAGRGAGAARDRPARAVPRAAVARAAQPAHGAEQRGAPARRPGHRRRQPGGRARGGAPPGAADGAPARGPARLLAHAARSHRAQAPGVRPARHGGRRAGRRPAAGRAGRRAPGPRRSRGSRS